MYKFQTLNEFVAVGFSKQLFINRLNNESPHVWDKSLVDNDNFNRGATSKRNEFKKYLKANLHLIQGNYCIYCGSKFRSKSDAQREHILPKETYPEFSFEVKNLVLACARCNGFEFKYTNDFLIGNRNRVYEDNEIEIIHPYLDDISEHLDTSKAIITIVNNSSKGIKTRDFFKLNNENLQKERGAYINLKRENLVEIANNNLLIDILQGNYHYESE